MSTKLTLWNGLDPRDSNVQDNGDDTNDPEHLGEVCGSTFDSGVSKNDREDLERRLAIALLGAIDNARLTIPPKLPQAPVKPETTPLA